MAESGRSFALSKEIRFLEQGTAHKLSDTPLHNSQRVQRLCYDQSAHRDRMRHPVPRLESDPGPDDLVCRQCKQYFLRLTKATARLKKCGWKCPRCSPIALMPGAEFDRYQFDNAGKGDKVIKSRIADLLSQDFLSLTSHPSRVVESARQRGERWTAAATPESLALLMDEQNGCPRQAQAFIDWAWGGLTVKQVAGFMGISERTAENYIFNVKKRLVGMLGLDRVPNRVLSSL